MYYFNVMLFVSVWVTLRILFTY